MPVDRQAKEAEAAALLEEVLGALRPIWPEAQGEVAKGNVVLRVPRERLVEVARTLRDRVGCNYLSLVSGVDWVDRLEVVYHLYNLSRRPAIVLKVDVPRDDPVLPSVTSVWPGADFSERETYDLFGIRFLGHPDLRRILLVDDFPGFPLRKDFTIDPEYVTMRHLRAGAEGQIRAPGQSRT